MRKGEEADSWLAAERANNFYRMQPPPHVLPRRLPFGEVYSANAP
jgi:hypothetical protein